MSNNIDIILTAVDNATKVIANVGTGIKDMTKSATESATGMNAFFKNNEKGFQAITAASSVALAGVVAL